MPELKPKQMVVTNRVVPNAVRAAPEEEHTSIRPALPRGTNWLEKTGWTIAFLSGVLSLLVGVGPYGAGLYLTIYYLFPLCLIGTALAAFGRYVERPADPALPKEDPRSPREEQP